ncbi:MAG: hypothetical protein RL266_2540 [Bacteroidota bacterium]|jgi:futalosine hydrolase
MLGSGRRILLVAATEMEMPSAVLGNADKLVTGVGMVATTHHLTKELAKREYDLVMNIGIAGAFSDAEIGCVVQVVSERLAELGVEDNGAFIPLNELKLVDSNEVRFFTDRRIDGLKEVNGITVNRVHGSADSIEKVRKQFNPDVESMEGAAVAFVCQQFGVPWVQIRAVSNKVEPRNRDAWNIPLAIKNLHQFISQYLNDEA